MSYTFNPFTGNLDYFEKFRVPIYSADPSSGVDGDLYYNSSDGNLYIYYGGWIALGSGTPPSEDGYWNSTNTNWNSTTTNWDAV